MTVTLDGLTTAAWARLYADSNPRPDLRPSICRSSVGQPITGYAGAPLFVGVGDAPGDEPAGPVARLEFSLPVPNPAKLGQSARFHYAVPATLAGGTYELGIYDLSGRLVKKVDSGIAQAGRWSLQWDLRNATGQQVHGGVYFARLSLAGTHLSQKFVILQ